MVAELAAPRHHPRLLLPPERTAETTYLTRGWRKTPLGLGRRYDDDAVGAMVQRIIADYVLTDEPRRSIARRNGLSDRVVNCYLLAVNWSSYGRPVLKAFERLGISVKRHAGGGRQARLEEIARAQALLLRQAADLLARDQRPEVRQVVADARLLSVFHEGKP